MSRIAFLLQIGALLVTLIGSVTGLALLDSSTNGASLQASDVQDTTVWRRQPQGNFQMEVLVEGRPLSEYYARGKTYVEAVHGAEYELRIRNPLPNRVAVALSVDGLNTIDARHTSSWNASKWVIEPYGSITISGWQMSSERARRFYFTNERDSYGAKLGQTENLGVISAVFYVERRPTPIPITPPRPTSRDERERSQDGASSNSKAAEARAGNGQIAPAPDDEYAATGIGRSVHNDVRWVQMDLDSRPAAAVTLRYEYYSALLRLGIVPRPYGEPYPLRRREQSRGFSPEP